MTDAAKADGPAGHDSSSGGGAARPGDPASKGGPRGSSRLSHHAQARIGSDLRSLYDSMIQQPVPDRFRDLIARLDATEPKSP